MDIEKFKGKIVEVRTKMGGLEMIGLLQGIETDQISLCPAVPGDVFGDNAYSSINTDNILRST